MCERLSCWVWLIRGWNNQNLHLKVNTKTQTNRWNHSLACNWRNTPSSVGTIQSKEEPVVFSSQCYKKTKTKQLYPSLCTVVIRFFFLVQLAGNLVNKQWSHTLTTIVFIESSAFCLTQGPFKHKHLSFVCLPASIPAVCVRQWCHTT